jgi:hypothetical protein
MIENTFFYQWKLRRYWFLLYNFAEFILPDPDNMILHGHHKCTIVHALIAIIWIIAILAGSDGGHNITRLSC